MEDKRLDWIGSICNFTDPVGKKHGALITAVHVLDEDDRPVNVNVVIVSDDQKETDQYGRQIVRFSSVVRYDPDTSAHGRYFTI